MKLELDHCTVDLDTGRVERRDGVVTLTERELAALRHLVARAGRAVSRDALLVEVWGYDPKVLSRTVDTTIRRIRTKLEANPVEPAHLQTAYGVGYRFVLPAAHARHAPVATLLGRDADLARLADLLRAERLVTVLGPAGIGKTTLARAVLAARDGEGWFVDLSSVSDADGVLAATAQAVGVPANDDGAALGWALAARDDALLVLDNAEHVVRAVAEHAIGWLVEAPRLRMLVTSRERLRVYREVAFALGPLAELDAAELLVSRAERVHPGWGDADDPDVRGIARALEGIPLALELAAARAGLLEPRRLRDRLNDQIRLLAHPARDRSDRQATLEGAVAWSWNLLPEAERRAFARLAVFEGPFPVEAAEAVLGADGLELVQALVDKSLLARSGPSLSMYAYLRAFAAMRLAERGERAEAEASHARFFLSWGEHVARGLWHAEGSASQRVLLAHRADLLAAARRAADPDMRARLLLVLDEPTFWHGPWRPYVERLTVALDEASHPGRLQARLLLARGRIHRKLGDQAAARADLDAALAVEDHGADVDAWGLVALAMLQMELGDHAAARATCDRALALATGNDAVVAAVMSIAGVLDLQVGDTRGALEKLHDGLVRARRIGDAHREGDLLGNLGNVLLATGRLEEARDTFHQALAVHETGGSTARRASVLVNLGGAHLHLGDPDAAEAAWRQALAALAALGQRRDEAICTANLGWLEVERGRLDVADAHLLRALAIDRAVGNRRGAAIVEGNLGIAAWLRGRTGEAGERLQAACAELEALDDHRAHAYFTAHLAAVMPDPTAARALLFGARAEASAVGDPLALELVDACRAAVDLGSGARPSPEHLARWQGSRSSNVRVVAGWLVARGA